MKGLNMAQVKLPQIKASLKSQYDTITTEEEQWNQVNPSCLLAYLGIRGFANMNGVTSKIVAKNALPIIAYYDIFKNYYANKQEDNFYLINYENQVSLVYAMTSPTGGTKIWQTGTPNRINENLPDEQNNTLQIQLLNKLDQDEFEALCTITINSDNSTPGITKMKTVKMPLTQYYEFYGYTPATKKIRNDYKTHWKKYLR